MKIATYNINGIRAGLRKGLLDWLKATNLDFVCFQEVKANIDQVEISLFEDLGYQVFWHSAEKKGYSGTVILAKGDILNVEYGIGIEKYDCEGRLLRVDTERFSLICTYMPSGTRMERLQYKFDWMDDFYDYVVELKKTHPKLIISGDYNICHREIDIHNPKRNQKNSGFLPEERAWMTKLLEAGFIDSFRFFNKEPHHYTWWRTYPKDIRSRNLGWRIDYHFVTQELESEIKNCLILPQAKHSDHCPVVLELV